MDGNNSWSHRPFRPRWDYAITRSRHDHPRPRFISTFINTGSNPPNFRSPGQPFMTHSWTGCNRNQRNCYPRPSSSHDIRYLRDIKLNANPKASTTSCKLPCEQSSPTLLPTKNAYSVCLEQGPSKDEDTMKYHGETSEIEGCVPSVSFVLNKTTEMHGLETGSSINAQDCLEKDSNLSKANTKDDTITDAVKEVQENVICESPSNLNISQDHCEPLPSSSKDTGDDVQTYDNFSSLTSSPSISKDLHDLVKKVFENLGSNMNDNLENDTNEAVSEGPSGLSDKRETKPISLQFMNFVKCNAESQNNFTDINKHAELFLTISSHSLNSVEESKYSTLITDPKECAEQNEFNSTDVQGGATNRKIINTNLEVEDVSLKNYYIQSTLNPNETFRFPNIRTDTFSCQFHSGRGTSDRSGETVCDKTSVGETRNIKIENISIAETRNVNIESIPVGETRNINIENTALQSSVRSLQSLRRLANQHVSLINNSSAVLLPIANIKNETSNQDLNESNQLESINQSETSTKPIARSMCSSSQVRRGHLLTTNSNIDLNTVIRADQPMMYTNQSALTPANIISQNRHISFHYPDGRSYPYTPRYDKVKTYGNAYLHRTGQYPNPLDLSVPKTTPTWNAGVIDSTEPDTLPLPTETVSNPLDLSIPKETLPSNKEIIDTSETDVDDILVDQYVIKNPRDLTFRHILHCSCNKDNMNTFNRHEDFQDVKPVVYRLASPDETRVTLPSEGVSSITADVPNNSMDISLKKSSKVLGVPVRDIFCDQPSTLYSVANEKALQNVHPTSYQQGGYRLESYSADNRENLIDQDAAIVNHLLSLQPSVTSSSSTIRLARSEPNSENSDSTLSVTLIISPLKSNLNRVCENVSDGFSNPSNEMSKSTTKTKKGYLNEMTLKLSSVERGVKSSTSEQTFSKSGSENQKKSKSEVRECNLETERGKTKCRDSTPSTKCLKPSSKTIKSSIVVKDKRDQKVFLSTNTFTKENVGSKKNETLPKSKRKHDKVPILKHKSGRTSITNDSVKLGNGLENFDQPTTVHNMEKIIVIPKTFSWDPMTKKCPRSQSAVKCTPRISLHDTLKKSKNCQRELVLESETSLQGNFGKHFHRSDKVPKEQVAHNKSLSQKEKFTNSVTSRGLGEKLDSKIPKHKKVRLEETSEKSSSKSKQECSSPKQKLALVGCQSIVKKSCTETEIVQRNSNALNISKRLFKSTEFKEPKGADCSRVNASSTESNEKRKNKVIGSSKQPFQSTKSSLEVKNKLKLDHKVLNLTSTENVCTQKNVTLPMSKTKHNEKESIFKTHRYFLNKRTVTDNSCINPFFHNTCNKSKNRNREIITEPMIPHQVKQGTLFPSSIKKPTVHVAPNNSLQVLGKSNNFTNSFTASGEKGNKTSIEQKVKRGNLGKKSEKSRRNSKEERSPPNLRKISIQSVHSQHSRTRDSPPILKKSSARKYITKTSDISIKTSNKISEQLVHRSESAIQKRTDCSLSSSDPVKDSAKKSKRRGNNKIGSRSTAIDVDTFGENLTETSPDNECMADRVKRSRRASHRALSFKLAGYFDSSSGTEKE